MTATWARSSLSMVIPVGRNNGSMTDAMNSTADQRHAAHQLDIARRTGP